MLIIFDCDGVLVDSEIIATKVEVEAFKELGFDIGIEEFASRFTGMTGADIIKVVEDEIDRGIPDTFYDDIEAKIDDRLAAEVEIIEGAHQMLDALDYARCVCSNSESTRLGITMKKLDLWDRFKPYIFAAREVGTKEPKPSPNVFLHAAKTLDFDPKDTIVIEDSSHGVEGAVAAGMRVIGFTGGSHTYPWHAEKLMEAGAETCINKLTDIPAVIEAYKAWDGAL